MSAPRLLSPGERNAFVNSLERSETGSWWIESFELTLRHVESLLEFERAELFRRIRNVSNLKTEIRQLQKVIDGFHTEVKP